MKSSQGLKMPPKTRITFDCSSGWLDIRRPVLEPFSAYVGANATLKDVGLHLAALDDKSDVQLYLCTPASRLHSHYPKKARKRTMSSNGQASPSSPSRTPSGAQSKTQGLGKK